jgi:hypothetical protein
VPPPHHGNSTARGSPELMRVCCVLGGAPASSCGCGPGSAVAAGSKSQTLLLFCEPATSLLLQSERTKEGGGRALQLLCVCVCRWRSVHTANSNDIVRRLQLDEEDGMKMKEKQLLSSSNN